MKNRPRAALLHLGQGDEEVVRAVWAAPGGVVGRRDGPARHFRLLSWEAPWAKKESIGDRKSRSMLPNFAGSSPAKAAIGRSLWPLVPGTRG